ncbi:MAG: 4Fe-4S binding protein [Clostridia bacterium]|nr:4Fe-4S binding protein [Clostridia bacterium]
MGQDKWNISFKTIMGPLLFAFVFYAIALWRYLVTGYIFYLYNFGYIGTALACGLFLNTALPKKHRSWGRRIAQLLVGSYLLIYVGFILGENLQLEGFFIYLLMGVFQGATLHYFIAKIIGPLLFNRGWCSWACWTAMVLDLLPWKVPRYKRVRSLGLMRYVHFFVSLAAVLYIWFILGNRTIYADKTTEIYWLAVGSILYFVVGIGVGYIFKDNRAFCKYICPVPVLQKITSRYAIMKVEINKDKCIDCGLCEKNCPMNIKLLAYKNANKRICSTECILCATCIDICPKAAVSITNKIDVIHFKSACIRN